MTVKTHSKQQIVNSKEQRVLLFAVCYLLCAVCYGQGFLPPKSSTPTAAPEAPETLYIGSLVSDKLTGLDENGNKRAVVSYKSAVELLVITFLSSDCPENEQRYFQLERLYEDYKDWKVAFVAINVGAPAERKTLTERLNKADVSIAVLDDDGRTLARRFDVRYTPEMVILDESRTFGYRGPVGKEARTAIEALIGHLEPVRNPAPAATGGCPLQ